MIEKVCLGIWNVWQTVEMSTWKFRKSHLQRPKEDRIIHFISLRALLSSTELNVSSYSCSTRVLELASRRFLLRISITKYEYYDGHNWILKWRKGMKVLDVGGSGLTYLIVGPHKYISKWNWTRIIGNFFLENPFKCGWSIHWNLRRAEIPRQLYKLLLLFWNRTQDRLTQSHQFFTKYIFLHVTVFYNFF